MLKSKIQAMLIAIVVGLTAGGYARADDRYYMMLFAAQSDPNLVKNAHTSALFVKASGQGRFPDNYQIESHSISWMPATLKIEPLRRDPEAGTNLSLAQSLEWAKSVGSQVTMWGPFPIKKELFDMAVKQEERLKSGQVLYLCLDDRLRGRGASNCIHAVSDLDTTQARLHTGNSYANEATKLVATHFEPHILTARTSNRWLVDRLDLASAVRFENPDLVAAK